MVLEWLVSISGPFWIFLLNDFNVSVKMHFSHACGPGHMRIGGCNLILDLHFFLQSDFISSFLSLQSLDTFAANSVMDTLSLPFPLQQMHISAA